MNLIPDLRDPRIATQAFDLRAAGSDWLPVDPRRLLARIKREQREGDDVWKVVPWQRDCGGTKNRSYLALCEDGGIYAIFLRRAREIG